MDGEHSRDLLSWIKDIVTTIGVVAGITTLWVGYRSLANQQESILITKWHEAASRFDDRKPEFEVLNVEEESCTEECLPIAIVNHGGLVYFIGAVKDLGIVARASQAIQAKAEVRDSSVVERASQTLQVKAISADGQIKRAPRALRAPRRGDVARFDVARPRNESHILLLVWRDADGDAFVQELTVHHDFAYGNSPDFKYGMSLKFLGEVFPETLSYDVPPERKERDGSYYVELAPDKHTDVYQWKLKEYPSSPATSAGKGLQEVTLTVQGDGATQFSGTRVQ